MMAVQQNLMNKFFLDNKVIDKGQKVFFTFIKFKSSTLELLIERSLMI